MIDTIDGTILGLVLIGLGTLGIIGVIIMASIAEISTKLDTVAANVAALKANQQPPGQQQAIDDLNAKADALVAASAPTPAQ